MGALDDLGVGHNHLQERFRVLLTQLLKKGQLRAFEAAHEAGVQKDEPFALGGVDRLRHDLGDLRHGVLHQTRLENKHRRDSRGWSKVL